MKEHKFSLPKRLKSFSYAWNGLRIALREEHNFRIHLLIAIAVVILGFIVCLTPYEWIAIILAIAFVLISEIFNSAIENIADFVSPKRHEQIKRIKDLAAAGVLLSAVMAAIVGVIIFGSRLIG